MTRLLYVLSLFVLLTPLMAQSPVDVGRGGMQTPLPEASTGMDEFATLFDESNVGFLHVYVDPAVDPLETYLLRGTEMGEAEVGQLPNEFLEGLGARQGKMYATIAVKGIEENLYLTRFDGPGRDQIDMFAIRDGKLVHLKTLAYLNCAEPGNCAQLDSYITDLNLDTTFDLVQISRDGADSDESRNVYTMLRQNRTWVETNELEVPWEGITFYQHPSANRNH
ncbi:hypothetical protein GGR28_000057 [Lewinella aquimaris]|uniref:Uncharacterized protein n=1 Tax=Neolewinella aquimaris TaxID=1835722 RepID=A0A840E8R7_9BACT|nr:hypothetical protein [Neolewinella aquimaris]MBB4077456.1 hypothetical protein [Neolewinella aquimaris]